MLVPVVDDDPSARKSTSTDVDGREINVNDEGASTVVNIKDLLTMADNSDNFEDRSTLGDGQNDRLGEDGGKPSNAESISQNKEKEKKKEKGSRGTGGAQNNTESDEVQNEKNSSEGI